MLRKGSYRPPTSCPGRAPVGSPTDPRTAACAGYPVPGIRIVMKCIPKTWMIPNAVAGKLPDVLNQAEPLVYSTPFRRVIASAVRSLRHVFYDKNRFLYGNSGLVAVPGR
jgi:hypothetical protein